MVGNPKAKSRTRAIGEGVAQLFVEAHQGRVLTVDLADYAAQMFSWGDEELNQVAEQTRMSDLLVVATPTYKGTYTGLLKSFFDRYPANGLAGTLTLPVMTGGSAAHSLAPTAGLAPLLLELGAIVLGRGLYFDMADIDRVDEVLDDWAHANADVISLAGARSGDAGSANMSTR
jgi:FMN reductase